MNTFHIYKYFYQIISIMLVQFASDLHLEFRESFTSLLKHNADVLCLAGDISACGIDEDFIKFINFIIYISDKYKYIIHVAGNHEYYTDKRKLTIGEVNDRLKQLMRRVPNYIYLDCNYVVLKVNNKKVCFVGATLWTEISPANENNIQKLMNDYKYIYAKKTVTGSVTKLSVKYVNTMHRKHSKFLRKILNETKTPIVLITHHKPIQDGVVNSYTEAYETDAYKTFNLSKVVLAIHGHTHEKYDKIIDKTRFVSNPKGYPGQHTGFSDSWVVKL